VADLHGTTGLLPSRRILSIYDKKLVKAIGQKKSWKSLSLSVAVSTVLRQLRIDDLALGR
jgi:hypothetical protein